MARKKWKRDSGWITPESTLKIKKEFIINEALEPKPFYDDWLNYRDGLRFSKDNTRIRSRFSLMGKSVERFNKKIRKHIKIRKIRQMFKRIKN